MDRDLFLRAGQVFDQVAELPEAERGAALDRLCAGDPALRAEVEALLQADARSGPLDVPAALAAAGPPTVRIGPYLLLAEIGRGGMGVVHLAERADGQFNQRVALKLVRSGLDSDEVRSRFLAERQILARLQHPGIARLLDGGVTADGLPWFALEHVQGSPILAWCNARRLGVEARLRLFTGVCGAVEYAHRNLVVHRDLKPSNILVTDAGEVKLLDFGIAKLLDPGLPGSGLTRGAAPMTPEYAAPEQILGGPATTATDVYGLGAVLYELLTGRRPFQEDGMSWAGLVRAVLEDNPEKPSTAVQRDGGEPLPGLPAPRLCRLLQGDLDLIVRKALHKEPERRYPSAEALREDLERHLDRRPLRAHPDSFGYRARKLVSRHRLTAAAAAFALLSLVAGAAATAWQAWGVRREAQKTMAVKDFLVSLFEVSDPDVSQGRDVSARVLLDRGAERVDRELADQPAVQAEMLGVVGDLYLRLGLYDRALPLAEREVAVRRSLRGEAGDLSTGLARLAALHRARGDLEGTERLLRQALAEARARQGESAAGTARIEANLGRLLVARGQDREAGLLLARALPALEAGPGRESEDFAGALDAEAQLLVQRGELGAALPRLEEVVRIRRRLHGERSSRVALALGNLAAVREVRGENRAAELLLRQVLALDRELYSGAHPRIVTDLTNLGAVLNHMDRCTEAEPLLRQALALGERLLGADNPQLASACHNLGVALAGQGRYSEAEPLVRRADLLVLRMVGEGHPLRARVRTTLGRVLAGQGRTAEAAEVLAPAVAVLQAAGPGAAAELAEARQALAACCRAQAAPVAPSAPPLRGRP